MSDVLENIQQLRAQVEGTDPEEAQRLSDTEKAVKRAMLTKDFGEHPTVVLLRQTLQHRLDMCDKLLANDEELDDARRREIFARKRSYQWFLRLFTVAEARVEIVNKEVMGKARKR